MGWDVLVMKLPPELGSITLLPDDFAPPAMGTNALIHERVSASFPNTDWSDPTWGLFDTPDVALEFSLAAEAEIDSFMVHVHGSGDPVTPLVAMARSNGWCLFDTSAGELINPNAPSSSWQAFQEWRNLVLGGS